MNGLSRGVHTKLSVMMFLQYAFNGIWIIPMGTYLTRVGYSGDNIGNAYGTFAVAGIIAPFFVGMVADKFFSAQKLLGVLNILGGLLLVAAGMFSVGADGRAFTAAEGGTTLGLFYWLVLAHFLCYMPTWALTNTIALRQMNNPAKQFPGIRVMGTIGWIVVSMVTLFGKQINELLGTTEKFEATVVPMYIGAALGLAAGVFAFLLPPTPPEGHGKQITVGDILGVKAFALFKDRNFAVFAATSFLVLLPGMFYWAFANLYLNESGMAAAMAWQSTGQMTEMVFLFVMPWFFLRFGVKKMLLIGLVAWILRFVCFAYGVWGGTTAFLVVLGLMLHGPCYDFFFVTGQLYTDKKAPSEIRAQAQGLFFLITFGLGWMIGSKLAGLVVDHYAIQQTVEGVAKITGHDWRHIWLWPIGAVALILVFFTSLFNDNLRVGHDESIDATVEEEIEKPII